MQTRLATRCTLVANPSIKDIGKLKREIEAAQQSYNPPVNPSRELELDGGIDTTTAPLGVAAGANVLVAGSAIFNHDDVAIGMEHLQAAILKADTN
jgi:pentose-5-phosphate-3-epimerase